MTRFSEKVREIIQNSGYTIYQIARQSGMGRTSLHKMMSGDLVPSREFMEKFYHYFRMLPAEIEELELLYTIEKIGPVHYENRVYIRQIIEDLAGYYNFSSEVQIKGQTEEELSETKDFFSTLELIGWILEQEFKNHEIPILYMNLPLRSRKLSDFIYRFLKKTKKDFQAKQIVMINQNPGKLSDANYNLRIFNRILPLVMSFAPKYEVHTCYSKCDETDSYPFLWPFYIITHNYVIMLSHDATSSYVQKNKPIIQRYQREFLKLYENTESLVEYYQDVHIAFQKYANNFYKYGIPTYSLENKPCPLIMMTEEEFDQLVGDAPEKFPEFYETLRKYCLDDYKEIENSAYTTVQFFPQYGIKNFLENRTFFDKTGVFPGSVNIDTAKTMLEAYIENIRKLQINANMILDSKIKIPENLMIEVFGHQSVILFFILDEKKMSFLEIRESSICEAFSDFFEYVKESDMSVSTEDSLKYIEKAVK